MSILNALDRLISDVAMKAVAGVSSGLSSPYGSTGIGNYQGVQQELDARNAYAVSAAVYACVAAYAFNYPQIRFVVVDLDNNPLPNHPVQKLLDRPNADMGQRKMALHTTAHRTIGGQCYWYLFRNSSGVPTGMRPFSDLEFTPIPIKNQPVTEKTIIDHYEYRTANRAKQIIPAEDVIMLQWPAVNPAQPWKSIPPIVPALYDVQADIEVTKFPLELMKNSALMSMIFTLPPETKDMPNDVYERIKGDVMKNNSGVNKFKPSVLRAGMTGALLLPDFAKLEFSKLGERPETRICADFRVPAMYAGFNVGLQKSTYNNVAEARAGFCEDSVVPLADNDADELTAGFRRSFGDGFRIICDTSNMYALAKKDNDRRLQADEQYQKHRTATLNEARAASNRPPVMDGDTFFTGPSIGAVPPPTVTPTSNNLEEDSQS